MLHAEVNTHSGIGPRHALCLALDLDLEGHEPPATLVPDGGGQDAGGAVIDAALDLFVMGVGFGLVLGIVVLLVQNAAPASQLGVATTSIRFAQVLGSALGAAMFGILLNRATASHLPPGFRAGSLAGALRPEVREQAVGALVSGVQVVFLSAAGVMAAALVLALFLRTSPALPADPPAPQRVTV